MPATADGESSYDFLSMAVEFPAKGICSPRHGEGVSGSFGCLSRTGRYQVPKRDWPSRC
jgi:hypothetical protein